MEIYARNDTHHLKPLADKLKSELIAKNRLAWHEESCAQLIASCTRPQPVDADGVWRIKGSSRLSRPALAVLRELWRWRDREAVDANRPPFFVLNHDRLVAIAVEAVINQQWESFLPNHMSPRRRAALMDAVKAGLAVPAGQQPEIIRHKFVRPGEAERHRFNDLIKRRDAHAHKLGIDSSIIAGKSIIGDLARDWDRHAPELMSWQRELLK
jgi:ribonuclease D